MVKPVHSNRFKDKFIKISTKKGGCTMKVFGDQLNPTIPYKTFVLSNKDTAQWIVKEMLEKYGLKHANAHEYCLVEIIIPSTNEDIREILLRDEDCPLKIYLNHSTQKSQESIVFKVIKCPEEYMQIRQQLQLDDRILHQHQSMLIEINADETNLPHPQVFKLRTTRIYLGRNHRQDDKRESIYIDDDGIELEHAILDNHHGILTVIPLGQTWLDGKLMSKPFILRDRAVICFGRHSTFRFYQTRRKSSIHTSLPTLMTNGTTSPNSSKRISMTNSEYDKKLNVLPGLIEVSQEMELQFLQTIFNHDLSINQHFRLTPVYTLYMTLRYRLSSFGKGNQTISDVIRFIYRIENLLHQTIEKHREHTEHLTYWLANTSEFVYFLSHDRDLSSNTSQIQMRLIKQIQRIFFYLINHLENQLDHHLINWTNSSHIQSNDNLFEFLSSIVDLFRKSRLNPRITLAIFTRLFYYINTFLFNRIVCQNELKLCSRWSGDLIAYQLQLLDHWALEQGLEFLSECYLEQLRQLCRLLQNKKCDQNDVEEFLSKGSLLINAIQMKEIFRNYIFEKNELPISRYFSQILISIAEREFVGRSSSIQLVEEANLNEPFHLPTDGYSCENLHGIPQQLLDFIEPMHRMGFCRLYTNAYSLGLWTEFLKLPKTKTNDNRIETIVLNKKNHTLGLNIVYVENQSRQIRGIYIKSIIPGSVAEENGYLQSGDQILRVNEINLRNASQEQATEVLKQSGPIVRLEILKNAAHYHGLSTLFQPPSSQSTPLKTRRPLIIREDIPTNGYHHEDDSFQSAADFEEKLQRRLAQYEQERAIERAHLERMASKRQTETEVRLRHEREREHQADRSVENFQHQRMSTIEQISSAKREQARLLKHMCLPMRRSVK